MDIQDALSSFCVISNGFIIVRTVSRSDLAANRARKAERTAASQQKPVVRRKNPEDALGDFMSEIDIEALGRDIDFADLDSYLENLANNGKEGLARIFSEQNLLDVCDDFETNIKDLVTSLVEKFPETVDVQFLKQHVRPLVARLMKDKAGYEQRLSGFFYKPIFEYL